MRFELDATTTPDLAVGYQVSDDGTLDDLARFEGFELGRGPDSVLARSILDDASGGLVAPDAIVETGYGVRFLALRRDGYPILGHDGSVTG